MIEVQLLIKVDGDTIAVDDLSFTVRTADLIASASPRVRLQSPRATDLAPLLAGPDVTVDCESPDTLVVCGLAQADVAEIAFAYGIVLHDLRPADVSLEETLLALIPGQTPFDPRK